MAPNCPVWGIDVVKGCVCKQVNAPFVCKSYTAGRAIPAIDDGNGKLEKADKFCYLRYMLNADEVCNSAVMAKVRCAWKSF